MSTATAQAIDEAIDRLHLNALNKLNARLDVETDPIRLERLLAIALRTRRSRAQDTSPPSPGSAGEGGRGFARPDEGVAEENVEAPATARRQDSGIGVPPTSTPIPTPRRTSTPSNASTDHQNAPEIIELPEDPAEPETPLAYMTDDEFHELFREVGLAEAHRRRTIQANLVDEQRKRLTNSS